MININNYEILKNNLSTLKEISKDDSETIVEYMTESILPVVNFDGVKTEYLKSFHLSDELAKSCDGLLCLNNKDILIEFKNGKTIKPSEIMIKIKESLLLLTTIITNKEILEIKNKPVPFCPVCRTESVLLFLSLFVFYKRDMPSGTGTKHVQFLSNQG